jgi:hypothetical protein
MELKAGDEIIVRGTDWVGNVVKQRIPNEDMYLVRFERYFTADKLQLMSEADAERRAGEPLPWYAPEKTAEMEKLTPLLAKDLNDGSNKLSDETIESMEKLGLIKNL